MVQDDKQSAFQPGDFTVLVVDDLEDNRDLLTRRLARQGYKVEEASDGSEALDKVEGGGIDLVLLDINMPGLSGIDVLRRIRSSTHHAQIPIIMATAQSQSEHVVEALDLGANDYVTKPINFPVLAARVKATLRVAAANRSIEDDIRPGALLASRYRLQSVIGKGGFGEVYRATHTQLHRDVAVKVLKVSGPNDETLARFQREGMNACRVQHPNAVAVLDSGVTNAGIPYLVMELVEGESLQEVMEKVILPAREALEIVAQVCDALHVAHGMGIVHRDVKPANILLKGSVAKVLDFGLSKIVGDAVMSQRITVDGWMVGTPIYMAPERFGERDYDGKSDVYALGIMLHQMITGQLPFDEDTNDPIAVAMMHAHKRPTPLRSHDLSQPPILENLILGTLHKEADKRPNAAELAGALRAVASSLPHGRRRDRPQYAKTVQGIAALDALDAQSTQLEHPGAIARAKRRTGQPGDDEQ